MNASFPHRLRHLGRVWLTTLKVSLIREMEFRGNFFLGVIRQLGWLSAFIFFITVMFNHTSSVAGWSEPQVFVIMALSRLIEGAMGALFIPNLMSFTELVNRGRFDYILLWPPPAQFSTAFRRVHIENIGNILGGLILLAYAAAHLSSIPAAAWAALLVLAPLGVLIYYDLLIIIVSLAFFIERLEAFWGINSLLSEPLTVPFEVFPRGARFALTYFIPLAFVVYVPAQALTGRLIWWALPAAVGLAIVFTILANLAWKAGLKRYSSASG